MKDPTIDQRQNTLVRLGQKYFRNETVFPLDLLVPKIESDILEVFPTASPMWLINGLRKIGYRYDEIFRIYSAIFTEKVVFLLKNSAHHFTRWLAFALYWI